MRPPVTAIAVLAVLVALGVAAPDPHAAGGESQAGERSWSGMAQHSTIERSGSLAGTLVVRPRCATPGDRVTIAVRNVGDSAMVHGVCTRLQRPSDRGWRETALTRNQVCIQIAAITRPGETNRIQSIQFPQRLRPGRLRALLVVTEKTTTDPRRVGLEAIFRAVRR